MASSASKVGSGDINLHVPASHSKLQTYGFVIAIIVGIGGLAVGAVGLAGYFHVGALNNMGQIDAIIMMATGGGIILSVISVIGIITRKSGSLDRAK